MVAPRRGKKNPKRAARHPQEAAERHHCRSLAQTSPAIHGAAASFPWRFHKNDKRMGRMLSFPRGFFDCLQDVSGNLDHSSAVNVAMLFAAATW